MPKIIYLLLGLSSLLANAETIDSEGRKWVTASELKAEKPLKYASIFKQFIIQDNNLNKCLFPDIYRSDDRGEAIIEQWWNDTENNGRMKRAHYLKLKMRLAQKIMPPALAEEFLFGSLSADAQLAYENTLKKYAKTVSIKSKSACQKIGQYATDLIEEYDEINEKWRKPFPNP